MSAVPVIPVDVRTLEQLDAWIDRSAHEADSFAARLRFAVAVMDRAVEIGERQRAAPTQRVAA